MTFASVAALSLLTLLGLGTVVAAFSAKRLIPWENGVLNALADTLQERRLSLEEDARLLSGPQILPQPQTQTPHVKAARRDSKAA